LACIAIVICTCHVSSQTPLPWISSLSSLIYRYD
jgi:hypothetical protein